MATLKEIAQQAGLNGGLRKNFGERQPVPQYGDRQFEYFSNVTHLFREQYLEYASDFFEAEIQNWDNGGDWETVYIRMADVVRPSAAIQRHFDEYKMVIPRDPSLNYLQPGTKLRAMGSYWLVVNPMNISGGEGSGIVRRCNTVWNHLDWYGNLLSEPIVVENARANASSPDSQTDQRIATGYYNVICQYNDFTRQINDNTRVILGSKAYQVTGYGDFETEFTGDYDSVRLLHFTIRVLTQNDETDDMENHVAGGKAFSMEAFLIGPKEITVGGSAQYTVQAVRNGQQVSGTLQNPITWIFASTDPEVVSVTANGSATALKTGRATIFATMNQNSGVLALTEVTAVNQQPGVRFRRLPPPELDPYQTWTVEADFYDKAGELTPELVKYSFSGAREGSWSARVDGNRCLITCFGYSDTPLTITASYGDESASVSIQLNGF